MPRKSLAEERSAQILQAFERCIAKYGLEGSSLEKIAEEAAMKRTIIRHYIGNRDDLVAAAAHRLINSLYARLDEFREAETETFDVLNEFLFSHYAELSFTDVLLVEQFIAAAENYPDHAEEMVTYVAKFTDTLSGKLLDASSNSRADKCWEIAYGITAILFNEASVQPLKLDEKYSKASRCCVALLMRSLED